MKKMVEYKKGNLIEISAVKFTAELIYDSGEIDVVTLQKLRELKLSGELDRERKIAIKFIKENYIASGNAHLL